jgi:hypothetical protein
MIEWEVRTVGGRDQNGLDFVGRPRGVFGKEIGAFC